MCYHYVSISGTRVTRKDLGLPENWVWIENWLNDFEDVAHEAHEDNTPIELKNSEIPILDCYDNGASDEFWSVFPKNYDSKLQKTVKIKLLKKLIQKCWFSWTFSERRTAKKPCFDCKGKIQFN
jgi:hypothetical protein